MADGEEVWMERGRMPRAEGSDGVGVVLFDHGASDSNLWGGVWPPCPPSVYSIVSIAHYTPR